MRNIIRKFRGIVESAFPPKDLEVIWMRNGSLYYYEGGLWLPLVKGGGGVTPEGEYVTEDELIEHLKAKQDVLKSGINIKTINNQSILGNGNIEIQAPDISDASDIPCNIEIEEAVATDVDEALKGIVAYAHKIKTEGTDTEPKTYVKSVNGQSGDVSVTIPTVLTREEYTQIVPTQGVLYIIKER